MRRGGEATTARSNREEILHIFVCVMLCILCMGMSVSASWL